ncbi:haloacid dehalogenase [Bisporella sp. PMI_857]|nr:haloacid dehalogenase [Bisporella sp. PMI_857]
MAYPKAIIFDLLTALLDSWKVWDAAAGSSGDGRRWRTRYLELTYGCGIYQPYEDLVKQAAIDAGLQASAPEALLISWDSLEPWPEVVEILAKLRARGILIGVVTNCSLELGRRAASRCEVPFDAVVTSEEAGYYKPHPIPYAAALSALDVGASDALFVAGSSADVPGATEAGMKVVWHNRVNLTPRPGSTPPLREGRSLDEALQDFL